MFEYPGEVEIFMKSKLNVELKKWFALCSIMGQLQSLYKQKWMIS